MTFPPEIWIQIIQDHANTVSHRTSLHPLLFVSREMYELTKPLMYERISKPPRPYTGKPSSTWIEALAAQPNLPLHLTRELTLNFGSNPLDPAACDTAASRIVSAMPNLKKLKIQGSISAPALFQSLATTAAHLTHLSTAIIIQPKALRDIAISQHSLETLEFTFSALTHLPTGWVDIPPDALPNLRTFVGDSQFWNLIVRGRAIEHLSGSINLTPSFDALQKTLANVRTLAVEVSETRVINNITPFLKSIECISLWISRAIADKDLCPEDMFTVPSSKLKYISHGQRGTFNRAAHAAKVFNMIPSLETIDYSMNGQMPMRATRFVRDNMPSPVVARFPQLQPWEPWWAAQPTLLEVAPT